MVPLFDVITSKLLGRSRLLNELTVVKLLSSREL